MDSIAETIIMLLVGRVTGISTGLTVASGVIIIPLLTLFLSFSIHAAIGTSLGVWMGISTVVMGIFIWFQNQKNKDKAASGAAGYAMHGEIGIIAGIGAILGGAVITRLENTFSKQKLVRLVGNLFVTFEIIMTFILANGNLGFA